MANIRVDRMWDSSDIRTMCIHHNYYTCGSNEEYLPMLNKVDEMSPTPENIYEIAKDICEHSDIEYANVEGIMFDIEREAVRVFYTIED